MKKTQQLSINFLDALAEIEFEYLTFFILREPRMIEDSYDRLKNHYWFAVEKGTPIFGFLNHSDLPVEIRMRCLENYIHYFPEGYLYGNNI